MNFGDTWKFKKPGVDNHLWILFSFPTDDGKICTANCTTYEDRKDGTVILTENHHDHLDHESNINYKKAGLAIISKLRKEKEKHIIWKPEPVSENVAVQVAAGAVKSPYTSEEVREVILKQKEDLLDLIDSNPFN